MDLITHEIYAHAAANVPVSENPTLSTNPFFTIAIQHDIDPYQVLRKMNIDIDVEPGERQTKVWTWCRFGQTCTTLPDGRKIYIGGEHEDWYDPQYPTDVFPPTDSHTATLLGDSIWIIGNLGYVEDRGDVTPVYRLDIKTLAINKVEVDGDSPGWINHHVAEAKGEDDVIVVTDKAYVWELDDLQRKWKKLGAYALED